MVRMISDIVFRKTIPVYRVAFEQKVSVISLPFLLKVIVGLVFIAQAKLFTLFLL